MQSDTDVLTLRMLEGIAIVANVAGFRGEDAVEKVAGEEEGEYRAKEVEKRG